MAVNRKPQQAKQVVLPAPQTGGAQAIPLSSVQRQTIAYNLLRCQHDKEYFIDTFCQIFDPVQRGYIPFNLWQPQREVLRQITNSKKTVILKPRQIGLTWLMLADALWYCLFRPAINVAIYSRAATQSNDTLKRLRDMYMRLPAYMRCTGGLVGNGLDNDNVSKLVFANGSTVAAHAPYSADMYTLNYAIIDEADHIAPSDLSHLLPSVEPAIEKGGKLVMLSRVDKRTALSPFKEYYRRAKADTIGSGWLPIFLPATAHPDRSLEWYDKTKAEILATTGSLDALYENYPMFDHEALATSSVDKRLPSTWLDKAFKPLPALGLTPLSVNVPNCQVYCLPSSDGRYVIGIDPAEGNPSSDDSVVSVWDARSGVECALLRGKYEPTLLAQYARQIANYYAGRGEYGHTQVKSSAYPLVVCERNNHGHTVISWLNNFLGDGTGYYSLYQHEDNKLGYITTEKSKSILYNHLALYLGDGNVLISSSDTRLQWGDITGVKLNAPIGAKDDVAMAAALAVWGFPYALTEWHYGQF